MKVGDLVYNQSIETWGMITKIEENLIKWSQADCWITMYCFDNGGTVIVKKVASNLEIESLTNSSQNKS